MIAERFAGHSGVKYLRSLGCERVQFKNQVCNPELRGLPAKSETLRLNSGVSWPAHGKRCRTAGFYSSVLSADSRFRSGLVIVSSGLLRGRRVQALMDIRVVILIRSHQLERRGLVCCHCTTSNIRRSVDSLKSLLMGWPTVACRLQGTEQERLAESKRRRRTC